MRLLTVLICFGIMLASCFSPLSYAQVHRHPVVKKRQSIVAVKNSKKITRLKRSRVRRVAFEQSQPLFVGGGTLSNEISRMVRLAGSGATVGVYVKSMKTGKTLYAQNIQKTFVPASISKILTAEAALLYLGQDYKFQTSLWTDAHAVSKGVLQGNLYVVLSGDPSLKYDDIADLLLTLRSKHIQAIAGNVYIDDTAYDKSFYGPGWIWKDKRNCYAAPIGASIINHNCIPLTLAPASFPGGHAELVKNPNFFYPVIRNSVITRTGRTRSCALHLTTDTTSAISIDGCMPRGRHAWGLSYVLADVPEYDRALIKTLLEEMGTTVYGRVTFGSINKQGRLLATHYSPSLSELVTTMLKKSDNVIAGAVFKKLGQVYTGRQGSWENGSLAIASVLKKQVGINPAGLQMVDGSGLSRNNLANPEQMMKLLEFAYHHPGTSQQFISSLPISGVDGTLKHRMGNIPYKVRAKTGTMSGVVSLAGYTYNKNKEPLAFVIMINGRNGLGWRYKAMEDKIVTALTHSDFSLYS